MQTKITEILGIKYPVFQGGMAWVADASLAAAVSNAGGLGIIGAGNAPPEVIQREIKKARELTPKPFGVNVMLMGEQVDEIVDLLCEEEVEVVTTGAGNPGKYMEKFAKKDIKVFPIAPTLALARRLSRLPISGIIAEGTEAGGHVGDLTTMVLVPLLAQSLDVPVIAAGGIVDGRGLAAALSLGADAVQMGTAFVCCTECTVHANYKKAIIKARDRSTKVTGKSVRRPVRCLENQLVRKLEQLEKEEASPEDFEELAAGSLQKAVIQGDLEQGSLMAGQSSALIKEIRPAREILESAVEEAERIFADRSKSFLNGVEINE